MSLWGGGESGGEIDLFFTAARQDPSRHGLIIPDTGGQGDVRSKRQGCLPRGADVDISSLLFSQTKRGN